MHIFVHAERKTPKKDKNGMVQAEEGGSRKRKQGTLNNLEPNGSKSVSYP